MRILLFVVLLMGYGFFSYAAGPDEDDHPTRVQLRETLLRLTGATPSLTDTARYHLSEASNTHDLEELDRKQLEALRDRLLRPETLIRSQGQEVYVSLLTDAEITPEHPAFTSLRGTINSLQNMLALPFIQELSLEAPLGRALSAYQSLCTNVCKNPPAQRKELLERRVLLHSDVLRGEEIYSIPSSLAYKLLSCDQYGFTTKPNREGTHAVCALTEENSQLYFKADLEGNHLTPGREALSHCVYQALFGEGVTPSCLLSLQGIPRKSAPFGTDAFKKFERCQNTQDAATFFGTHPQYQVQFSQSGLRSGVAQVSMGVVGESLDTFVERVRRGETTYDVLDLGSVSLQMLAHYILGVSDGKGDNFMVTTEGKIIGIDNDEILAAPIRSRGDYHTLGLKSLLYCIGPLMDREVDVSVREQLLSRSPLEHMLEISRALLLRNQQYRTLMERGVLEERLAGLLSLPLRLSVKAFQAMYDRLEAVHRLLREHPHATHKGILKRLSPLIASYYERLRKLYPNAPAQALQMGYGQGRTEVGAPVPSTFEELLGAEALKGYDDVTHYELLTQLDQGITNHCKSLRKKYPKDPQGACHVVFGIGFLRVSRLDLREVNMEGRGQDLLTVLARHPSLDRVYVKSLGDQNEVVRFEPSDLSSLEKVRISEGGNVAFQSIAASSLFEEDLILEERLMKVSEWLTYFCQNQIDLVYVDNKTDQYCIGRLYVTRDWVDKVVNSWPSLFAADYKPSFDFENDSLAIKWLSKAVEANQDQFPLPHAFYRLGFMYLRGRGVDSDITKAERYFNLANEYGHPRGQSFFNRSADRVHIGVLSCSIL